MKKTIHNLLLCILLFPSIALTHGPSRVLIKEEISVNASTEKVWSIISDFCSIKTWHPAVTDCTSDKGNAIESVRTITLENGEEITEILAKHKPEKFMLQHYMKDGQTLKTYPITTHSLTITVTDDGNNKSIVQWKGAFYRAFQGPNPPPELSDKAATEKLTIFYKNGLQSIKAISESSK